MCSKFDQDNSTITPPNKYILKNASMTSLKAGITARRREGAKSQDLEFQNRYLEFKSRDLEFKSRDLEFKDYYGMA